MGLKTPTPFPSDVLGVGAFLFLSLLVFFFESHALLLTMIFRLAYAVLGSKSFLLLYDDQYPMTI